MEEKLFFNGKFSRPPVSEMFLTPPPPPPPPPPAPPQVSNKIFEKPYKFAWTSARAQVPSGGSVGTSRKASGSSGYLQINNNK